MLVSLKENAGVNMQVLVPTITGFMYFTYLSSGIDDAQKVFAQNLSWTRVKLSAVEGERLYTK